MSGGSGVRRFWCRGPLPRSVRSNQDLPDPHPEDPDSVLYGHGGFLRVHESLLGPLTHLDPDPVLFGPATKLRPEPNPPSPDPVRFCGSMMMEPPLQQQQQVQVPPGFGPGSEEEELPCTEKDLAEDAPWKKIQQNTFTRWCNEHLKVVHKKIHDLQRDLGDGLKLVGLLEVLSHKNMYRKYHARPNFRQMKLENVSVALEFLEREHIRLVSIGKLTWTGGGGATGEHVTRLELDGFSRTSCSGLVDP